MVWHSTMFYSFLNPAFKKKSFKTPSPWLLPLNFNKNHFEMRKFGNITSTRIELPPLRLFRSISRFGDNSQWLRALWLKKKSSSFFTEDEQDLTSQNQIRRARMENQKKKRSKTTNSKCVACGQIIICFTKTFNIFFAGTSACSRAAGVYQRGVRSRIMGG